MCCSPDGNDRDQKAHDCGARRLEPYRPPEHERKNTEQEDVSPPQSKPRIKDDKRGADSSEQQAREFGPSALSPECEQAGEGQRKRRDEQHPHGVAQPPHEPGRGKARPGIHAREEQNDSPDRRSYCSAADSPQNAQSENISKSRQWRLNTRNPPQQPSPAERPKSITHGDSSRGQVGNSRKEVHDERPQCQRRPDPIAEDEYSGQRYSCWRP